MTTWDDWTDAPEIDAACLAIGNAVGKVHQSLHSTHTTKHITATKAAEHCSAPRKPQPKPIKEYESLVEMVPVVRAGGEIVPPSEYGAADATETATKFIDNLVQRLSAVDKAIVYRSLLMHLRDLLDGAA